MLNIEIIEPDYPTLNLSESTVGEALSLQAQLSISSFPVIDEEELKGLLSVNEILHLPGDTKIETLQQLFARVCIPENEHFFSAFKVLSITGNVVPVIDAQNKYRGTITQGSLHKALHLFLNIENGNDGIIILEMDKADYSFSEISRLVESGEANIIQLNSYFDVKAELFVVTIKIDRKDISDIVSTLQRHDYHVAYYFGEELYENEIKRNYDALMNYLSI